MNPNLNELQNDSISKTGLIMTLEFGILMSKKVL